MASLTWAPAAGSVDDGAYRWTVEATDGWGNGPLQAHGDVDRRHARARRVGREATRRRSRCSRPTATARATASRSPPAASEPGSIVATVRDADGDTVDSFSAGGRRLERVTWHGTARSDPGYVADGRYEIAFAARDRAGNTGDAVSADGRRLRRRSASSRRRRPCSSRRTATRTVAPSTLSFRLDDPATVPWTIVDADGDVVRTLKTDEALAAGSYSRSWDGRNDAGHIVPRGTYRSVVHAIGRRPGRDPVRRRCSPTRSGCRSSDATPAPQAADHGDGDQRGGPRRPPAARDLPAGDRRLAGDDEPGLERRLPGHRHAQVEPRGHAPPRVYGTDDDGGSQASNLYLRPALGAADTGSAPDRTDPPLDRPQPPRTSPHRDHRVLGRTGQGASTVGIPRRAASSLIGAPGASRRRPCRWRRGITAAEEGRAPDPVPRSSPHARRSPSRSRCCSPAASCPGRRSRRARPRPGRRPPARASAPSTVASPAATAGAGPATGGGDASAPDEAAVQHPSIAYEQAMEHAGDDITFKPGGRVKVGLQPKPSDDWPVDGQAPEGPAGGPCHRRRDGPEPAGERLGGRRPATPAPARHDDPPAGRPPTTTSTGAHTPVDSPAGPPLARPPSRPSARSPTTRSTSPPPAGLRRQVFGFLPYWELSGASGKVNYDVLSTIAYFSVGADRGRQHPQEGLGRHQHHRLGRLDELEHDLGHLQRPPARHARGPHGQRVRLDHRAGQRPARPPRQRVGAPALARQVVAAVRDRGADGVNLDFEPARERLRRRVRLAAADLPQRAQQGPQGLPAHLRHDGLHRELPARGLGGGGCGRRDLRHGLRLPDVLVVEGRLRRPARPVPATTSRTPSAPTRRASARRGSSSALPWYGRAWSTADDGVRSTNISGAKYGYSTAVNYENVVDLVSEVRAPLGCRRAEPVRRLPAQELHDGVRLRHQLAAGLLRRRGLDQAALLARQRLRPARRRHVGARLRRRPRRAVPGRRRSRSSSTSPRPRPASGSLAAAQGDEGFVVSWAARDTSSVVSYDVQVSIDGGAWRAWLTATQATSDVWLGADGHGYAFRVRARRQQGQRRRLERRAPPGTRRPRSRRAASGASSRDGLAYRDGSRHRARPGSARSRGHDRRDHARPGLAGRLHVVRGHGADPRVVARLVRRAGRVDRGEVVVGDLRPAVPGAELDAPSTPASAGSTSGRDPRPASGPARPQLAARAFSPNGDGSRTPSGSAGRTPSRSTRSRCGSTARTARWSGARRARTRRAGAQAWDWNGSRQRQGREGRPVRAPARRARPAGARTARRPPDR